MRHRDLISAAFFMAVEILADYARHIYRARVGEVSFVAPFDTPADEFTQLYFGRNGASHRFLIVRIGRNTGG
jgi:hypothetical protein